MVGGNDGGSTDPPSRPPLKPPPPNGVLKAESLSHEKALGRPSRRWDGGLVGGGGKEGRRSRAGIDAGDTEGEKHTPRAGCWLR